MNDFARSFICQAEEEENEEFPGRLILNAYYGLTVVLMCRSGT